MEPEFESRAPKRPRMSTSQKANLIFPPTRIRQAVKSRKYGNHAFSMTSAVFLAGVIEYLADELCELAGAACKKNGKTRIQPRHIALAIGMDGELKSTFKGYIIKSGGVVPAQL